MPLEHINRIVQLVMHHRMATFEDDQPERMNLAPWIFPAPENFTQRPCNGCNHLHGVEYNGVMFVCAMHPPGVVGDCSDYEKRQLDEPVE